MTTMVTVGAAAVIVLFALLGAARDLPRGIVAFTGVLFGATLVSFWAAPFAGVLSQTLGNPDLVLLQRFASMLIFSLAALVLGVGSGLLLPRITGSTVVLRLVGGLLGTFSGAVAAGFLLTYAAAENPSFITQLQASPVGAPLFSQLDLILGIGAVVIALAVGAVGISRLLTRSPVEVTASPVLPPAVQRSQDQAVLGKIKDRTG